jgi:hypothetical protein
MCNKQKRNENVNLQCELDVTLQVFVIRVPEKREVTYIT